MVADVSIVLVGPGGVGKTSLCSRLLGLACPENYFFTIQDEHWLVMTSVEDGKHIARVHIVDTAGQQEYSDTLVAPLQNANAVVYVIDSSQRDSLAHCSNHFRKAVVKFYNNDILHPFVIVNKADVPRPTVNMQSILCSRLDSIRENIFIVSAKADASVTRIFAHIVIQALHARESPRALAANGYGARTPRLSKLTPENVSLVRADAHYVLSPDDLHISDAARQWFESTLPQEPRRGCVLL